MIERDTSPQRRLADQWILVTRPAEQAERLSQLIEAEGGQVLRFPTVEIGDPKEPSAVEEIIRRLDRFHWAVFVSANAVKRGLPWVLSRREMPADLKIAVVGQATAQALADFGLHPHLCPTSGYNSEALLAMDELQHMSGSRVVIFRGSGGRELLAGTLAKRGAQIEYAEVYRRCLPPPSVAAKLRQTLASRPVDVVITTSKAVLENLCYLVGEPLLEKLRLIPLVVIGSRQAQQAKELGFTQIWVAQEPSDTALVQAIIEHEDKL
ncbi:uroporphyrinogen-III synthase [Nitrosococcus wardiae]|uniref:Uroporphyrinogen-III synthase n=1 Tax=Nitrosococcus wardiae TaxID=1814290 RepID=A0A4P7BX40_9GAMM|nr:uroporphyrinogen-III synthase [Nitrosococcus wardiae]QBQ53809.1 uroporphyrinogen-III synthase [Nitrosococcus wardiae]